MHIFLNKNYKFVTETTEYPYGPGLMRVENKSVSLKSRICLDMCSEYQMEPIEFI